MLLQLLQLPQDALRIPIVQLDPQPTCSVLLGLIALTTQRRSHVLSVHFVWLVLSLLSPVLLAPIAAVRLRSKHVLYRTIAQQVPRRRVLVLKASSALFPTPRQHVTQRTIVQ